MIAEPDSLQSAAADYLAAGLCVLPAKRVEKRPAIGRWKQYRKRLPTVAELSAWFANGPDALCILCGKVSGNGEMIDFDAGGVLFDAWTQRIPSDLLAKLVIESTQRGGRHVYYLCEDEICGNMKLAQRREGDKIVTLIETRGEGGLFLCAPTPGYELIQGDLAHPPVLTLAERDMLLQAAWELNEYVPPVVDGPTMLANVRQRDALSVGQCQISADKSHIDPMWAENAQRCECPTDIGDVGQTSASSVGQCGQSVDNSNISAISADNSHNRDCPTDNAVLGRTSALSDEQCASPPENADRPGDDFNHRGDVRHLLEQHGWVRTKGGANEYWRRPGKTSGMSATLKDRVFYVFSSNAAPFEPNQAYSPFAVYTLLEHGGDFEQAARSLRKLGFGGAPHDCLADHVTGIDISAIVRMSAAENACRSDKSHDVDLSVGPAACPSDNGQSGECPTDIADPGPMPAAMLRIPGFVSEVMDFTLQIAPYPNPVLAFCGALSLLALLAGRKVRDPGDNRTNIYLLGLAHSSAGKDWPRKVNTRILHEVGMADCLGDKFASGEGIQDALFQTPSLLFQTDEIDGMLQSINKARDARHEAVMSTLLTMYSSANSIYPMRRKAGKESPGVIDQPNLVLFGTAIPNHYYEALSERMLTNGFFARMLILDVGSRGSGQEPSIHDLPQRVLETARWWADYRPGTGNLEDWHPVPTIVEHTDEARRLLIETRKEAEHEYTIAEGKGDPVGTTVWGRVSEHVRKLALLYAVSENHQSPRIGIDAVRWASDFVLHQTRRMLFMAASHVADNPFHAECLKLLEKLRDAPGNELPHSVLLKRMKMDAKTFSVLIETLAQQGDIEVVTVPRAGSALRLYRLARGVKPEGETSDGGEM